VVTGKVGECGGVECGLGKEKWKSLGPVLYLDSFHPSQMLYIIGHHDQTIGNSCGTDQKVKIINQLPGLS
jgi:hypothetical protein